jgi:hypothetical protein
MIADRVIEGEPHASDGRADQRIPSLPRGLVSSRCAHHVSSSAWTQVRDAGASRSSSTLTSEGPDRYFLTGRDATGGQIRVQLGPGRFEAEPEN